MQSDRGDRADRGRCSWKFSKDLEPGVFGPAWSPDGRTLYYLGTAGDFTTIRALDTQATTSTGYRVVRPGGLQDRYLDRVAVRAGGDTITAAVRREQENGDSLYTVERFSLSTGRRLRKTIMLPGDGAAVVFDTTGDHLLFIVPGKALIRVDDGHVRTLRKGHTADFVNVGW